MDQFESDYSYRSPRKVVHDRLSVETTEHDYEKVTNTTVTDFFFREW